MSDIFDNAIDSVEFGVHLYVSGGGTSQKHAILAVFQGIELFLKERLHRENPILIYKNIDRRITDDSLTVGLDDAIGRFANLGIGLSDAETSILRDLRRRRNQIQHHKYEPQPDDLADIGRALKFVYDFLPAHLDSTLEDHLEDNIFTRLREMIHDYDELVAEAERQATELSTPYSKDDMSDMVAAQMCPNCGTETLVIGSDRGDFCHLCRQDFHMEMCGSCSQYVDAQELEDFPMCSDCFEDRVSNDRS